MSVQGGGGASGGGRRRKLGLRSVRDNRRCFHN